MSRPPNVFTVRPGLAFADALAAGLKAEADGPLALADVTVLVPTRRAVRAMADAFLRVAGADATVLPRLTPIGDIDDDEIAPDSGPLDLAPAIAPLRRNLLLARLIRAQDPARSPAQAARLAAALARLLDQVETEGRDFAALADLVPARYAAHWQVTLDFLRILTAHWPGVLADEGCLDPAERRNRAAASQVARWRDAPPRGRVVVAGSTGSIPATAELIAAVAALPNGAVVLPGLDRKMDAETRKALTATHPQHAMMRLLDRLGVAAEDVADWPAPGLAEVTAGRAAIVAAAMRPAALAPADPAALDMTALDGVTRLDCAGPQEEAATVALVLRWALDVPGRTAALVTPDRALARRVAAELGRWQIAVDDSAGTALDATPPGVFLRLTAEMAAARLAPVALLAALKHPLAAGGMVPGAFRARVRQLERLVLRGPRPAPGFAGLDAALEASDRDEAPSVRRWLAGIAAASEEFLALVAAPRAEVGALLAAHAAFAQRLAATDDDPEGRNLWAGEAGEALAGFVAELSDAARAFGPVAGAEWPSLLAALIEGQVVRPRWGRHPRLAIWGPLEARLQRADVLVLGGLNEGTWPPDPGADPWLSRPMRADFGLPPPEWRIGLSAHDFAQAFSAPTVVLTRATRVAGAPTVPSRWLLRLEAIAPRLKAEDERNRRLGPDPVDLAALQAGLDDPAGEPKPVSRPAPCPPVAARPRKLSVTRIEAWMRDPYAIYAEYVLGLRALDPIDADPGAAERGMFVHAALNRFVREFPDRLPAAARERLLELGRAAFGAALERPGVWAFWWPRFARIADWVIETERARRPAWRTIASEASGETAIAGARPFVLNARADRLDAGPAGLAIIDYKTGGVPAKKDIALGLSPQLALEAVIAERGGFAGVPAGAVAALAFWQLSGADPAGKDVAAGDDIRALIDQAASGIERLVRAVRRSGDALPLAALARQGAALFRLRAPRPRQGMVRRRGRGMMARFTANYPSPCPSPSRGEGWGGGSTFRHGGALP